MFKKFIQSLNSRIATKLALWVILFSILLTLVSTGVQLYTTYRHDVYGIEDSLDSIGSMQLQSISKNVWIMDDSQIVVQLEGIIKGRDICYAAVHIEGEPGWESGSSHKKNTRSFRFPLRYEYNNSVVEIGSLQIVADIDAVYQRLQKQAVILLLTNSFQIFFLAGFILYLFQYSVTRHLEKLASHVVTMDFRKKIPQFHLKRKIPSVQDEFSQVVDVLNMMQRRGYNAFNALEKSENRLRLFFDSTEEGIFGVDLGRNFIFANRACLEKLGCNSMTDLIGKNIHSTVIHSSTTKNLDGSIDCLITRSMSEVKTMVSDEGVFTLSDGSNFFTSIRSYPIISGKKCTGVIVIFNDISEQRELLKEKNLLRQAVIQLPVMIIVTDARGNIEYVNPGFEKISGYTLAEIAGNRPYFLGKYSDNKTAYREIRKTVKNGEKWQGRYCHRNKEGAALHLDTVVSPVFDHDRKIVNLIAVCLDVTQNIELQNQLNNVQKRDAVGRLSASFAHEFGNPLMGVRSVIDDIRHRSGLKKEDRHLLDLAYSECDRMKKLIRNFQQFHRNVSVERERCDIHNILDNVLFLYKKHLETNNIILQKEYGTSLPQLLIKKDQIAQVFLNLVINSVDAMSQSGGILSVVTTVSSNFICIKVADTGIGIRDDEIELIFEPFFTTKPEVEGTGLGLPVSYGIVASHGGDITVESDLNQGTTFTVSLPFRS